MKITIYTDGSSRGNPGKGGWASILLTSHAVEQNDNQYLGHSDDEVIELGGREEMTTNNRMELMGTIMGLREIDARHAKVSHIEVCTDSEYVRKGMTTWIKGWIKNGWKTSTKKDVLNKDLWEDLLRESERLQVGKVSITWTYVEGHAGIPGNERADSIATSCADNASSLQLYRGARLSYPYF